MKLVVFGTSAFAVPTLDAVADRHDVLAVVTQPDRPAGRGHALTPTPVKAAALARGLDVRTPTKLRPFADELRPLRPDAFVVVSYGRIVPQNVLDLVPVALNVHPSLLPLYRGATPLQAAIRDGRDRTGVTIIAMDAGMDTGDVLLQEPTPLGPDETYGELHDRLALRGARLAADALALLAVNALERRTQAEVAHAHGIGIEEIAATATRPLTKEDLMVDWTHPPRRIVDLVRSLAPQPAARALIDGETVKLLAARVARPDEPEGAPTNDEGTVHRGVVLLRVVPPNRAPMTGAAWRRSAVRR